MLVFLRNFAGVTLCVALVASCGSQTGEPNVRGDGFGELRFGMKIAEAEQALGRKLVPFNEIDEPACRYYHAAEGLSGVSFMTADGIVVRIDVQDNTGIVTD